MIKEIRRAESGYTAQWSRKNESTHKPFHISVHLRTTILAWILNGAEEVSTRFTENKTSEKNDMCETVSIMRCAHTVRFSI